MKHHLKHVRGKGVALKLHSAPPRRSTIISESIPSSHRCCRDWTNEGSSASARLGPHVQALIDVILSSRPYPEHGFRSAILSQSPPVGRLCVLALTFYLTRRNIRRCVQFFGYKTTISAFGELQ